jgi:hypothetical protein
MSDMMRRIPTTRLTVPRLALLISLALLLAMLMLPAAQGVAAPASQSQSTQTPVVIVATATPTSNPTPDTPTPDAYEPNNRVAEARPIEIGGKIDKLNFLPDGDVDYFVFFVKPDMVGLTAILDTYITFGLDTRVRVLRPDGSVIVENDDASPGDKRSHLAVALGESGYFIVEVSNTSIVPPGDKTYALETRLVTAGEAAAQPTPGPEGGKPDAYENNYDFDHAPEIPVGQQIDGLNFLCPPGASANCGDNDFFAVSLKGGVCYTAQTLKLSPGIDTNLIVYGPQRDVAPPWAGSDDAASGVMESRARFCVPRGVGSIIGYILVGNAGNRIPPAPAAQRTYSLRVDVELPPTPTPAPVANGGNAPPPAAPPSSAPAAAADAPKGAAIVIAESTALRDAPNAQGTKIQTLPQETMVILQGQASGAWVRVQVANGVLPGWVYGPDLKRIDDTAATAAARPSPTPSSAPEDGTAATAGPTSGSGSVATTGAAANTLPTPHIAALQPTPPAVPTPAQRISLAVSVLLVNSGATANAATPIATGAGTPTPRAGGLPPLQGMRVQLVNAFGDVLAEAITPDSGEVTLRRDLTPGTAVFIRVPSPGLQVSVDTKQPTSALTIAIPVGG